MRSSFSSSLRSIHEFSSLSVVGFLQLSALQLLLLAALCVDTGNGIPVPVGETMRSAGGEEPSGDEGKGTLPEALSASPVWGTLIGKTAGHQKQVSQCLSS